MLILEEMIDCRDNVFVAGGAVLACLQPLPSKVMKSGAKGPTPRALREYFHNQAYPAYLSSHTR